MASVTKTFTATVKSYATAGSYAYGFGSIDFGTIIPSSATNISCTSLSVSYSGTHDTYDLSYRYITDGSNPSSGSGYTYRYDLSTAGCNSFLSNQGINKTMKLYIRWKNTSSYYDFTLKGKVTVKLTYTTTDPDPTPTPTPSGNADTRVGSSWYITSEEAIPVSTAVAYNKKWYKISQTSSSNYGLYMRKTATNDSYLIPTLCTDATSSAFHMTYKARRITQEMWTAWYTTEERDPETGTIHFNIPYFEMNTNVKAIVQSTYGWLLYHIRFANEEPSRTVTITEPDGREVTRLYGCSRYTASDCINTGLSISVTQSDHSTNIGDMYLDIAYIEDNDFTRAGCNSALYNCSGLAGDYAIDNVYGIFRRFANNQIQGDFATTAARNTWTANNCTVTYSNRIATLSTVTTKVNNFYTSANITSGHKYLLYYDIVASQNIDGSAINAGIFVPSGFTETMIQVDAGTTWSTNSAILTANDTGSKYIHPFSMRTAASAVAAKVALKRINLVDLTELGVADSVNSYDDFAAMFGHVQLFY